MTYHDLTGKCDRCGRSKAWCYCESEPAQRSRVAQPQEPASWPMSAWSREQLVKQAQAELAAGGTVSTGGLVVDASRPTCGRCGQPMPPGEEMFQYHGYSGPCPATPTREADAAPAQEPCQHDELGVVDNDGFRPCLKCGVVRRWPSPVFVTGMSVAKQPESAPAPEPSSTWCRYCGNLNQPKHHAPTCPQERITQLEAALAEAQGTVEHVKQQTLGTPYEGWRKGISLGRCVEEMRMDRDMFKRKLDAALARAEQTGE